MDYFSSFSSVTRDTATKQPDTTAVEVVTPPKTPVVMKKKQKTSASSVPSKKQKPIYDYTYEKVVDLTKPRLEDLLPGTPLKKL